MLKISLDDLIAFVNLCIYNHILIILGWDPTEKELTFQHPNQDQVRITTEHFLTKLWNVQLTRQGLTTRLTIQETLPSGE